MNIFELDFAKKFIRLADTGWQMGWHERNGGNLSYRLTDAEAENVKALAGAPSEWRDIGTCVPTLSGECFMVTGSGKYMSNVKDDPEDTTCIIEVSSDGEKYRILAGLVNGGKPTSELPTHLMNHEVCANRTNKAHRVIYHCHPVNIIALSFILPLKDEEFSRELWEMMTECPIIFPAGIGVVEWMVPGGRDIAVKTSEKMKTYDAVVWAHHGLFCSGEDFDLVMGLAHTIEKSAEIYIKVHSVVPKKRQTITKEDFIALAKDFNVDLNTDFLK